MQSMRVPLDHCYQATRGHKQANAMNYSQHHQHPTSNTSLAQETRILTTFPAEGLPEPRVEELRRDEVLYPPSAPGDFPFHLRIPLLTQLNRWFCCQCATRAIHSLQSDEYRGLDKIGMVNNKTFDRCHDPACSHIQCANCAIGPGFGGLLLFNSLLPPEGGRGVHMQGPTVVRTVAGLHAHPFHIDPCHWECACREWISNVFDSRCTMHLTRPDSVVLNRYGQRLGTADQRVVERNGPWMVQRQGLSKVFERSQRDKGKGVVLPGQPPPVPTGPPTAVLLDVFRPGTAGYAGDEMDICDDEAEKIPVWKPGCPAPRYRRRRAPPPPPPLDKPEEVARYLSEYLASIPRGSHQPMSMASAARGDVSRPGLVMMSGRREDDESRSPLQGAGFSHPPRPGHHSGHRPLSVGVTAAMPSTSTRSFGVSSASDGRISNGWHRM
ncbi:hypothetical protein NCU10186 [Neurospora crassa OR74A]|uniref:Uncharacterized protein n=1 Tax=Neurospora crassa (strain ATCC 24698 / 74-OR23-1A / CBS 708.71 / DSM 1257 / FGSC 987) TaxID=367110 RepID=A7UWM7_NEUCR|nr:hypothetical protein NCU10186 [Neurospora crassa OR74A]EDO65151.2 hypothetical protein NCU10186 [Neurospora crassa OR74A]|eukprot:XP_001728242.2 hypothetical protein NCU10186 [Neurospora crassa OR74A]